MKYPQIRGKTGKVAICRNQEYEHRIRYATGKKKANREPRQFFEYIGPRGAEDCSSASDEHDEEAAVPQIQELPGSGGEELPLPVT